MKWLAMAALASIVWWFCCAIDFWGEGTHAKSVWAEVQIVNFLTALDAYRRDVGQYPTTAEGLDALRVNPGYEGWDGPYMPKDIPRDPWGHPYVYAFPGAHGKGPDIVSYGADGKPGGEGANADIASWRRQRQGP